jgi:plasmid stability protein
MGEIRVRDVDDAVLSVLKDRARRNGRSLAEELRGMLTAEAFRPRREIADGLQKSRDTLRAKYGEFPDSAPFIRSERDRRG